MKTQKAADLIENTVGLFFFTAFVILFNIFYDKILFLSDKFDDIRPFYNATLITGIILNFLRYFIKTEGYKLFTDVIENILFIVLAYIFWTVFPFNTSVIGDKTTWDGIFRFLIIVPPVVSSFGLLVSVIKVSVNNNI